MSGKLITPRELLERRWRDFTSLWNVGIDDRDIGREASGCANNAIMAWARLALAADESGQRDAATGRMDSALAYLRRLADERFRDDRTIVLDAANGGLSAVAAWARIAQAAADPQQRDAAIEHIDSIFAYLLDLADERFPRRSRGRA